MRDGDRTVMTMANDFQGEPEGVRRRDSGADVPASASRSTSATRRWSITSTPTRRRASSSTSTRTRAETRRIVRHADGGAPPAMAAAARTRRTRAEALGVTIEAQYTVGEYDILILSAQQSSGLETWLRENGYRIPAGASEVLGSYLKQNMRFFVAKVNLTEQAKLGFSYLRPLQVAYESPKFMLPIRLGMVNADGPQELFVYALTRKGRVETTNYRTVQAADRHGPAGLSEGAGRVLDVLQGDVRAPGREAGQARRVPRVRVGHAAGAIRAPPIRCRPTSCGSSACSGATTAAVRRRTCSSRGCTCATTTRTSPRTSCSRRPATATNFQGRYVLRHAWTGGADVRAAIDYRRALSRRRAREAEQLASLTGWSSPTSGRRWDRTHVQPKPRGGNDSGGSEVR